MFCLCFLLCLCCSLVASTHALFPRVCVSSRECVAARQVVEPWAAYGGVVLDATNPLTPWPALDISTENNTSAAEELQKVVLLHTHERCDS